MAETEESAGVPASPVPRAVVIALSGAIALSLGARAQATPAWGPGTPRNGAGQPVDAIYGTPLPGYPAINAP